MIRYSLTSLAAGAALVARLGVDTVLAARQVARGVDERLDQLAVGAVLAAAAGETSEDGMGGGYSRCEREAR